MPKKVRTDQVLTDACAALILVHQRLELRHESEAERACCLRRPTDQERPQDPQVI